LDLPEKSQIIFTFGIERVSKEEDEEINRKIYEIFEKVRDRPDGEDAPSTENEEVET